jgi:DNA-directed RNA polymerase specialized sigma24 family protein
MTQVSDLAEQVGSEDPAIGLAGVRALRDLLERLEDLQVDAARRDGWSWQEIGAALGVSRQAVHKKHGGGRRLLRRER